MNKNANENCKSLINTLMNIFRNFISHKTKQNWLQDPWVDEHIDHLCARKRSTLVKRYYRNLFECNKGTLLNQANERTKLIIEAKENYITKTSSKLGCPDITWKTYWSIINKFLNKKRCQIYSLSLLTANSYPIFIKKTELFIQPFAEKCTLL